MAWMSPKSRPEQPELELERSPFEIVLQMVGAAAVALHILTVIYYWRELAGPIPIHFDLSGQPDGWGGRYWLLMFPLISAVMWGGLTLLTRIPHRYNYLWPITAENARLQYRLAREMISGLSSGIAVLFAFMTLEICRLALGRTSLIGTSWPIVILSLLLVLLTWYFVRAYRAR